MTPPPPERPTNQHAHALVVVTLTARLGDRRQIIVYDWRCPCGWTMRGTRTEAAYYGQIID